jgi:hypothetical protein
MSSPGFFCSECQGDQDRGHAPDFSQNDQLNQRIAIGDGELPQSNGAMGVKPADGAGRQSSMALRSRDPETKAPSR